MGNAAGQVQAGRNTGPESRLLQALAGEKSSSDFSVHHWGIGHLFGTPRW